TSRAGFHSYQFPKSDQSNLIVDLVHRDHVLSSFVRIISEYEIEGLRRSQSWAGDQYVYFVMRFSKPFKDFGLYLNEKKKSGRELNGNSIKAHFTFSTKKKERINVKIGISSVSVNGARANLDAEIPHWSFTKIKNQAQNAWKEVVDRYQIQSNSDQKKRIFYTALYHQYLNPNVYMDVDSMYRGRDLLVHKAEEHINYTLFSLWDTFRATHPLFTITEPTRTNNFIRTFTTQFEEGGMLPVWELAANETGTMIGYHAVSVIADAYMKGISDYDIDLAYTAMKTSAMQDHLGLNHYKKFGYIPASEESESVSKTLEYAYDDWCIAQLASDLGYSDDYEYFIKRAQSYKNLFDPSSGFMRAKLGAVWFSPFNPKEVNFNYTEANAWQYSFFVPQDVSGLIELSGGDSLFNLKLDQLFSESSETTGRQQADITGLIGQYAHGNEPSHHMAYLYSYSGEPWKTQKYVDEILNKMYSDQPDGLCGNEDCGQMSAWYVLSALGFYPLTPGLPVYTIGTPLFPEASITLENGAVFRIKANNRSEINKYIQSLSLNGEELSRTYIFHEEIMNGGLLEFVMGDKPNYSWGLQQKDRPKSQISDHQITIAPYVKSGDRTFSESTLVELASIDSTARIYYEIVRQNQIGRGNFRVYSRPLRISYDRKVRFYAVKDSIETAVFEAYFNRISSSRKIELHSQYTPQYSAGGEMAMIDMIRGARNFRTGAWQGYEGKDLSATIDLGFNQTIHRLALSCFQDQDYWIFMPESVEYELSLNGTDWTSVGVVENELSDKLQGAFIREFKLDVWRTARYIRFKAKNKGICPIWHKGAGGKAWVFVDELIIE
ncbi:MAG: glycoside hydrolase family 92 protein, partial [Bacteroidetes bacterium]|nr:glycoside hydrolase family 92 protein [Bacteroidota bacterium]